VNSCFTAAWRSYTKLTGLEVWNKASYTYGVGALGDQTAQRKANGNRANAAGFLVQRDEAAAEKYRRHDTGATASQNQVDKRSQRRYKIWTGFAAVDQVLQVLGPKAIWST